MDGKRCTFSYPNHYEPLFNLDAMEVDLLPLLPNSVENVQDQICYEHVVPVVEVEEDVNYFFFLSLVP